MDIPFHQFRGNGMVMHGWRGDHSRIEMFGQLVQVRPGGGLALGGDALARRFDRIDNSYEGDVIE